MAYEINLQETASRSIHSAYRETLEKTARVLGGPDPDGDDVHEARTSVKKARTLLRLMRPGIGGALFEKEMGALREVGQALSAVRDAVVLVEAIDGLLDRASDEDHAVIAELRAALAARRDRSIERSFDQVAQAARVAGDAHDRLADLEPEHSGWKALAPGLDRAYRRARERAAIAFETDRDEDFHALRKAVKELAYQAHFLHPIDASALRAEESRLKRLGDLLGEDHDLALLRGIAWQPDEATDPAAVTRLAALVAQRRAELRGEARGLAGDLLSEPPPQRLARLRTAFRAASAR